MAFPEIVKSTNPCSRNILFSVTIATGPVWYVESMNADLLGMANIVVDLSIYLLIPFTLQIHCFQTNWFRLPGLVH